MFGKRSKSYLPHYEDFSPETKEKNFNELYNHTQKKLFGNYSAEVRVGVNPNATIAAINPRYQGYDFGVFKVPTINEIIYNDREALENTLNKWSRQAEYFNESAVAYVPPETGRAMFLPESEDHIYRDILVKGTGRVEKYIKENKLRDAERDFNGCLELSEAERDLVHTDILCRAGILVAPAIAVVNHNTVEDFSGFTEYISNYVRAFRSQTRISNLFDLPPILQKAVIDDAISHLSLIHNSLSHMSYEEYFQHILKVCARNVAIMQAIGFTQDSFHYGQITLCGELVDFGIGHFNRPHQKGVVNTLHPWFRYERQPILMQNILYKTHSVKAEPNPIKLPPNSKTVLNQKTLFGSIKSFAPQAAKKIQEMNPVKIFWKTYEKVYSSFNSHLFKQEVIEKIQNDYFFFDDTRLLKKFTADERGLIRTYYENDMLKLRLNYEQQDETWSRRGPTSIHQMLLFFKCSRKAIGKLPVNNNFQSSVIWPDLTPNKYFFQSKNKTNPMEDLSWKPYSKKR